jgi:hypothetical protein
MRSRRTGAPLVFLRHEEIRKIAGETPAPQRVLLNFSDYH